VAIYSINWHNKIGVSEVEKGVQWIQVYLKKSGLGIAPNKQQKMGAADWEWEIVLQREKVSSAKSVKYVGLHLKSYLDWKDGINAIGRKCEIPMKTIHCVKHT
jgi:hypothetical protein